MQQNNLTDSTYHAALNSLDSTLCLESVAGRDDLIMRMANSVWGQKDYFFYPQYLDVLAFNYGASMYVTDFRQDPEGSCRTIISWISDNTQQCINNMLTPNVVTNETRLILVNAIYFKTVWSSQFKPGNTRKDNFYLADGNILLTPLMYQRLSTLYYEEPGQYQTVRLYYDYSSPYSTARRYTMVIFLPVPGQFENLGTSFNAATLSATLANFQYSQVDLTLPKFEFEWSASLIPALKAMGMNSAFSAGAADFSAITDDDRLYIFEVMHKAFIALDENSTEAAAAAGSPRLQVRNRRINTPERLTSHYLLWCGDLPAAPGVRRKSHNKHSVHWPYLPGTALR